MEKLQCMVPKSLLHQIAESSPHDLLATCSSLLDFFSNQPLFHQIVGDLTNPEMALCRKNKEAALELKSKGNQCYSKGNYIEALSIYSKALRIAPVSADEKNKNLMAVLYVNRASVLHKMGLLAESIRDCGRALALAPTYAKAWYRRGKVNVSLERHDDALRDLKVAMNLEPSSAGKRQIEDDWNLISVQFKIAGRSMNKLNERSLDGFQLSVSDKLHQGKLREKGKLHCVSTPTKGRGMASVDDVPESSLIHFEEPYAVTILKPYRETHCHFCMNELPIDTVPCLSCSISVYCSRQCQELAGGLITWDSIICYDVPQTLPDEIKKHIVDVAYSKAEASGVQNFEHKHECNGVHWPAVLPTEIVLAGRILVKTVQQQRHCSPGSILTRLLDLSHNYSQLLPERKLELHIFSIILLYCLQQYDGLKFPMNGVTVSTFVILLAQIKVNSMAIVRIKFQDPYGSHSLCRKSFQGGEVQTSSVDQVKVGQAVYLVGSLFNHSCQPNIHAYFLNRTLCVRSTEFIEAGCPLELSYGPQVGENGCKIRQEVLEDRYSFRCSCRGCSELNLPDIVINAFRCIKPNCFGVVLDNCDSQYEKQKILGLPSVHNVETQRQADKIQHSEISEVASQMLHRLGGSDLIKHGVCLNCGFRCDLEALNRIANKAKIGIKSLQHVIDANEVQENPLSDALISLDHLRSTLHAYNKRIAELEDNLAHAFCFLGKLQLAVEHCKASIEILKKLYGHGHIAIGNELLKLSSIQLALSDPSARDSINQVQVILSRYYGSHMDLFFPNIQFLRREACKLSQ